MKRTAFDILAELNNALVPLVALPDTIMLYETGYPEEQPVLDARAACPRVRALLTELVERIQKDTATTIKLAEAAAATAALMRAQIKK